MNQPCKFSGFRSSGNLRRLFRRSLSAIVLLAVAWVGVAGVRAADDPANFGFLGPANEREAASRDLHQAHETAEKARADATAAKAQLDQFLEQHFAELRDYHGSLAVPKPTAPKTAATKSSKKSPAPQVRVVTHPDLERLQGQLQDLKTRREELLERVTELHPEVVDVDERIAEISRRLAAIGPTSADAETLPTMEESVVVTEEPGSGATEDEVAKNRAAEVAAEKYAQIVDRWRAAERERQSAIEAEFAAAQRLSAIKTPIAPAPAAAPAPEVTYVETQGSQPLALAALLIALAVALLAAVRLARSSTESVFANVDEVAAALALPVMGIFPANSAKTTARTGGGPFSRPSRLFGEVLLAIIAFAVAAYIAQSPDLFSQFGATTPPEIARTIDLQ